MRCSDIMEVLEALAPLSYACDWDNAGLLAGRRDRSVKKLYIALDATDEVIADAVEWGADMLLTHHPLIFSPMKQINDGDFIGRRLLKLIEAGISYYAMHTNFDVAPGCMADLAAERLLLEDCQILEVTGEDHGSSYGVGKTGILSQGRTLEEISVLVKEQFELPHVVVYGDLENSCEMTRISISPGSGKGMMKHSISEGAQVLITGDITHHEGIDAVANGLAVIDAGHYGLEHIFINFIKSYVTERFGKGLEVKTSKPAFPSVVL